MIQIKNYYILKKFCSGTLQPRRNPITIPKANIFPQGCEFEEILMLFSVISSTFDIKQNKVPDPNLCIYCNGIILRHIIDSKAHNNLFLRHTTVLCMEEYPNTFQYFNDFFLTFWYLQIF